MDKDNNRVEHGGLTSFGKRILLLAGLFVLVSFSMVSVVKKEHGFFLQYFNQIKQEVQGWFENNNINSNNTNAQTYTQAMAFSGICDVDLTANAVYRTLTYSGAGSQNIPFCNGSSNVLNVQNIETLRVVNNGRNCSAALSTRMFVNGQFVGTNCGTTTTNINVSNTNQAVISWQVTGGGSNPCLLYTSPSPRDLSTSRMPSSA